MMQLQYHSNYKVQNQHKFQGTCNATRRRPGCGFQMCYSLCSIARDETTGHNSYPATMATEEFNEQELLMDQTKGSPYITDEFNKPPASLSASGTCQRSP
jgi:hypothetical protein